jgi:hypothetical protein
LARFGQVWQGLARFGKVWQGLARFRPVLATLWPALASVWPVSGQFVIACYSGSCEFWPVLGLGKTFSDFQPCGQGVVFRFSHPDWDPRLIGTSASPPAFRFSRNDSTFARGYGGRVRSSCALFFSAGRSIFAFQREPVFSQTEGELRKSDGESQASGGSHLRSGQAFWFPRTTLRVAASCSMETGLLIIAAAPASRISSRVED